MSKKIFFLILTISILAQKCIAQSNEQAKKAILGCNDILTKPSLMEQLIYFDTMTYNSKLLLFVTQDSTFFVYSQDGNDCDLLFKTQIDSTDLYSYTDGSKIYLQDIDGDGQKEIGFTVYKDQYSKYQMYRIIRENEQISFKRIKRLEELYKPEFDTETGLIRSHIYGREGYEVDEYYRLSKGDILTFVKGFKISSKGVETNYTTKEGW